MSEETRNTIDEITLAAAKRTRSLLSNKKNESFSSQFLLLRALMALDYTIDEAELTVNELKLQHRNFLEKICSLVLSALWNIKPLFFTIVVLPKLVA